VQPEAAIEALQALKAQAEADPLALGEDGRDEAWKGNVRTVIRRGLGENSEHLSRFSEIHYGLLVFSADTPASAWNNAFIRGLNQALGVIDAAIYDLSLSVSSATEPVDEHAFDPELWARVKREVEEKEWDKIPALVEVFVEDRFRAWAGDPRGRDGNTLVGKGLFESPRVVRRLRVLSLRPR
jgi:hypothetical protein